MHDLAEPGNKVIDQILIIGAGDKADVVSEDNKRSEKNKEEANPQPRQSEEWDGVRSPRRMPLNSVSTRFCCGAMLRGLQAGFCTRLRQSW